MQVAEAIEIDHVKIMRHRPERGDLFMEAGVGWRPGAVKSTAFPADLGSPPGRSFQTALPVVIESMDQDPEFRMHPLLEEHGIISVLNVPIMVDGAALGRSRGRQLGPSIVRPREACSKVPLCAAVELNARGVEEPVSNHGREEDGGVDCRGRRDHLCGVLAPPGHQLQSSQTPVSSRTAKLVKKSPPGSSRCRSSPVTSNSDVRRQLGQTRSSG